MASNAENVSVWCRHHGTGKTQQNIVICFKLSPWWISWRHCPFSMVWQICILSSLSWKYVYHSDRNWWHCETVQVFAHVLKYLYISCICICTVLVYQILDPYFFACWIFTCAPLCPSLVRDSDWPIHLPLSQDALSMSTHSLYHTRSLNESTIAKTLPDIMVNQIVDVTWFYETKVSQNCAEMSRMFSINGLLSPIKLESY